MTSHSPSTSASDHPIDRASPCSILLPLWAVAALLTLWRAEDVRDWVVEADHATWARAAAERCVAHADELGLGAARDRTEALRAALYGVPDAPPAPPQPLRPRETQILTRTAGSTSFAAATHEVAPRPRRVLLIGASSMQFALGQAFEKQLTRYQALEIRRLGKASTGLSRPDGFNWPARLEQLLHEHAPDLVIVNFGGNDAQNIPLPDKRRAEFGTTAWDQVYGDRVADFVTRVRARGAQAIMIGMPIMRSADFSQRMARLNKVIEAATIRAGGTYLDQWDLAATPAGGYRERVDEAGKSRAMRMDDGIHYTEAGGRFVVERLLVRLERVVRLVPEDAKLGVVERHTFTSQALGQRARYLAWLPRVAAGERVPLLVLLHGADASPDDFSEHLHAALATAAQTHRIAIVAPDGTAGGWWLDSPERPSSRYASLVATDLIADVRENLPVSEATGIAGVSMGGHGALTLAFEHRQLFRTASSVSGVVDLTRASDRTALTDLLGPLSDQRARWESRSALHVLERAPERARGLALRLSCGASDRWIEPNRTFHARATALHIPHAYDEAPAGHEWSYWAAAVPDHVAWHAASLRSSATASR